MRLSGTDRQAMIDIIGKWKLSGLSQKMFYQQQNMPAHVFYYWHKCYRDQHKSSSVASSGGFIQLKSPSPVGNVEIQWPNGVRVIFNEQVSVEFVKALIS